MINLLVTLWPSFPHYSKFSNDERLAGIRLNSAMINHSELEEELGRLEKFHSHDKVKRYFDVKGRQLRVEEASWENGYLEVVLNHPVALPVNLANEEVVVLFKAGEDHARLRMIHWTGNRLTFYPGSTCGPVYNVLPGESLHIRHPELEVFGPQFTELEMGKIERVKEAGFDRWFLSYVQCQKDVDEFRELVGKDAKIFLKIEDKKGLEYMARDYRPSPNVCPVAAMGDLFVEIDKPHEILAALRLIIEKDSRACVGSRLLLSTVQKPLPSAADLMQLAWLRGIGYRTFMLCDELCLDGDMLSAAVNVFDAFRQQQMTLENSRHEKRELQNSIRSGRKPDYVGT